MCVMDGERGEGWRRGVCSPQLALNSMHGERVSGNVTPEDVRLNLTRRGGMRSLFHTQCSQGVEQRYFHPRLVSLVVRKCNFCKILKNAKLSFFVLSAELRSTVLLYCKYAKMLMLVLRALFRGTVALYCVSLTTYPVSFVPLNPKP